MKIAVSGKGGVGKTTILALLASELARTLDEVLVIDADPSPHMAQTLGLEGVERVTPIAEMRELLVERSGKVEGSPFYNINPRIDDLPVRFMLRRDRIRLMVLGAIQSANKGCACPENLVLKRLLTKLLLSGTEAILIDMEAGVEHLGRGTLAGVDHLLVVVIPTRSGARTAIKIRELAVEVGIRDIAYVGNLVTGPDDEAFLAEALGEAPIACFPDSTELRKAERDGKAVPEIASHFATVSRRILETLAARRSARTTA
jgi:CO dehydrogenase maturation factor